MESITFKDDDYGTSLNVSINESGEMKFTIDDNETLGEHRLSPQMARELARVLNIFATIAEADSLKQEALRKAETMTEGKE